MAANKKGGGNSGAASSSSSTDNPYYKGMDAYQILDIPKGSDIKAVRSAFRKAVAKWHPDRFPNDEEKKTEAGLRMEKINRAHFCLGDEDRKKRYDHFGEDGVGNSDASEEQLKQNGGPGGFGMGGGGGMGGGINVDDFGDIFEQFFGGGGMGGPGRGFKTNGKKQSASGPVRGEDLHAEIDIPLLTAVFGAQEKIRVRRQEQCGACSGSGVKPGAKVKTCGNCNGQGMVTSMQRTPFGVMSSQNVCGVCRGTGEQVEEYCGTCHGAGTTTESKEVIAKIPGGVDTGATLRIREAGNAGRKGGARGDLFVTVNVKPDPRFRREGDDIYTTETISFVDAALGTTLRTDTVDGSTDVKIPPGTQPEQKLRLKGKGVTKLGSSTATRGDSFIVVKIKVPPHLSTRERELLEQLKECEMSKKKQ